MGILYHDASNVELASSLQADYSALAAYSFLTFNLLCAPCFAAIGAIKREMNDTKWTLAAIAFQTGLAYAASLIVFQLGRLISEDSSVTLLDLGSWSALVALSVSGYAKTCSAKRKR